MLLERGIKAAAVRADGYGAQFSGGGGQGGGAEAASGGGCRGLQQRNQPHNRRVTFSVIQEIKIDGSVQFGAMSSSIGTSSEPLLKKVALLLECRFSLVILPHVTQPNT